MYIENKRLYIKDYKYNPALGKVKTDSIIVKNNRFVFLFISIVFFIATLIYIPHIKKDGSIVIIFFIIFMSLMSFKLYLTNPFLFEINDVGISYEKELTFYKILRSFLKKTPIDLGFVTWDDIKDIFIEIDTVTDTTALIIILNNHEEIKITLTVSKLSYKEIINYLVYFKNKKETNNC